MQIRTYDRKGLQSATCVVPMTDPILSIQAAEEHVWAITAYAVTCFSDAAAHSMWHATEAITSCTLLPLAGRQHVLVGCQDCCVRLLDGTAVLQVCTRIAPPACCHSATPTTCCAQCSAPQCCCIFVTALLNSTAGGAAQASTVTFKPRACSC